MNRRPAARGGAGSAALVDLQDENVALLQKLVSTQMQMANMSEQEVRGYRRQGREVRGKVHGPCGKHERAA